MSDLFLFFIGCFVTLMVGSAVSLLLWAAYNEPRTARRPKTVRRAIAVRPGPARPAPVPIYVRPSRNGERWDRSN